MSAVLHAPDGHGGALCNHAIDPVVEPHRFGVVPTAVTCKRCRSWPQALEKPEVMRAFNRLAKEATR